MLNISILITVVFGVLELIFFIILVNTIRDVKEIKEKLQMNKKDPNEGEKTRLEIAFKNGLITEADFNEKLNKLTNDNQ